MTEWLNANTGWLSVAVAVLALVCTLIPAIRAIRESNRARDFGSVQSLRQSLYDTSVMLREKAIDKNTSDDEYEFHAGHFLDVLEFGAYTINHKLLGPAAIEFLGDWLKSEVRGIYGSEYLKPMVAKKPLDQPAYKELRAFCGSNKIALTDAPGEQ